MQNDFAIIKPQATSHKPQATSPFLYRVVSHLLRPSFSAKIFWYLRSKALISKGILRLFYTLLYSRYTHKYHGSIPISTRFDSLPVFPHGISGVFISAGAKIGKGCTIFHQVTIGSNTLEGSKHQGAPVIGDNVFIGCGAKIIGGVHIGDNVCIGAGCVITKDIPPNSTAVMPEFRVLPRKSTNPPKFLGWAEFPPEKGEGDHDQL